MKKESNENKYLNNPDDLTAKKAVLVEKKKKITIEGGDTPTMKPKCRRSKMTKEVAKAQQTALSTEYSFDQYAGAGLENVTQDDVLIPRLTLLQALSPQLKKNKPEYIEGASEGDIADVGTGEIFEGHVHFLPVHFQKVWIEWAPRESGKGLIAIHESADCMEGCEQNDRGQWVNSEGNYIVETSQFFGFNLSAGGRRCFIAFSSTQLKKARRWNTLAMSEKLQRPDGTEYTPPLFYRTYKLGSAEESNSQGDWAGWTIERDIPLLEHENFKNLFQQAVEFREQLQAGAVKADNSDIEAEAPKGSAGDDGDVVM